MARSLSNRNQRASKAFNLRDHTRASIAAASGRPHRHTESPHHRVCHAEVNMRSLSQSVYLGRWPMADGRPKVDDATLRGEVLRRRSRRLPEDLWRNPANIQRGPRALPLDLPHPVLCGGASRWPARHPEGTESATLPRSPPRMRGLRLRGVGLLHGRALLPTRV